MQIVIFCIFQCFTEKEYRKESKRNETFARIFFWNKRNPGDLEWTSRKQRGGHETGRRAQVGRHAPHPRGSPNRLLSPIYTLIPRKHPGEQWNLFSTAATLCTREIPSLSLFQRFAGEGIDHGGLLHQHHSLPDDVWVVYSHIIGEAMVLM